MMGGSFAGLGAFIQYFVIGAALNILFATLYVKITTIDEIALIREGNLSAALSLGGNLAGFSIPLDKAIAQASSTIDCLLWAFVAMAVQFAIYALVRLVIGDVSAKIAANNVAVATFLALSALVGGTLNAAAMTLFPGS